MWLRGCTAKSVSSVERDEVSRARVGYGTIVKLKKGRGFQGMICQKLFWAERLRCSRTTTSLGAIPGLLWSAMRAGVAFDTVHVWPHGQLCVAGLGWVGLVRRA